jgi:hypothetical protein
MKKFGIELKIEGKVIIEGMAESKDAFVDEILHKKDSDIILNAVDTDLDIDIIDVWVEDSE